MHLRRAEGRVGGWARESSHVGRLIVGVTEADEDGMGWDGTEAVDNGGRGHF